jgi:HD-like signal output (HDOD) protein
MQLKTLLAQIDALPSAPHAVLELARTFEDDDARTADVVAAIESDPVLVAQLLRVANSPVFFRGRPIEGSSEAVRLLGLSQVRALVIGLLARDAFPALPEDLLQQFWRFSLNTAELARHLTEQGHGDDDAYIGGLLHLIGALAMRVAMPERMAEIDVLVPAMAIDRIKAETRAFGYSYAEVGAELTYRWRLPPRIVRIVDKQRAAGLSVAQDANAMVVQVASWRARAIELALTEEEQLKLYPAAVGKALGLVPTDVMAWTPDQPAGTAP